MRRCTVTTSLCICVTSISLFIFEHSNFEDIMFYKPYKLQRGLDFIQISANEYDTLVIIENLRKHFHGIAYHFL